MRGMLLPFFLTAFPINVAAAANCVDLYKVAIDISQSSQPTKINLLKRSADALPGFLQTMNLRNSVSIGTVELSCNLGELGDIRRPGTAASFGGGEFFAAAWHGRNKGVLCEGEAIDIKQGSTSVTTFAPGGGQSRQSAPKSLSCAVSKITFVGPPP